MAVHGGGTGGAGGCGGRGGTAPRDRGVEEEGEFFEAEVDDVKEEDDKKMLTNRRSGG